MTSTRGSECPAALREAVARIRASRLRKAGLAGAYASADCEEGRRVYGLVERGRGAYLWGAPGRGKTYVAACAVRLRVEADGRSGTAKLVTAKRLLDDIRDGYDGGDRRALERAERYGLLALDDLGAERPTEWAVETLTRLIDARTTRGLPTIVTSNLKLSELRSAFGGISGARVASRLAGACERIEFTGPDRRLL